MESGEHSARNFRNASHRRGGDDRITAHSDVPPGSSEEQDGDDSSSGGRFRRLLEAAPDAILEIDPNGRILFMNAATERLFGYAKAELSGLSVDVLVPNEVRARHAQHRANYMLHPQPRPMGSGLLLQGQRKDGTRFPVEVSLSPFQSDHGFRIGAIIRDVTERTAADERLRMLQAKYTDELEAANRELALRNREVMAANQLKTDFVASMSHELRTPLHTIIGFAELLEEALDAPLSEQQARFVGHILKDGRHLLELINDILDISKIEAGRLELRLTSFNWLDSLNEVVASVESQAQGRKILLDFAGERLPEMLTADRVRFKEILFNLLSNAVKFTPAGGRVWIEAGVRRYHLFISVCDTGIGISKYQQERIFEKFYQAAESIKGIREGTGLGLPITQYLVENHGGTIHVESEPGQGSRFTFNLPLDGAGELTLPAASRVNSGTPLLLVIESDSVTRQILTEYLERHGYRTESARTSEEALDKARQHSAAAIEVDALTPAPPVVFVCSSEAAGDIVPAAATVRFEKPVDPGTVVRVLNKHVSVSPDKPAKIIVVDDEQSFLDLLQEVLGSAGYVPIQATSGQEALEIMARTQVSAAIVDLLMPVMNGFEFMLRVRDNPRLHHIPLFALAGRELAERDLAVVRRNARAVFLKREDWCEELLGRLRRLGPVNAGIVQRERRNVL